MSEFRIPFNRSSLAGREQEYIAQAMQIVGSSPEAFASFIKQDIAIWKEVADQAKVEVR